MSALNGLKLVQAKPQQVMNPMQQRRCKLIAKLDEQIALARAKKEGAEYTPLCARRVKDADGNVTIVQKPKRVKPWFWTIENGKCCIAVRYGNKIIELAKGKTAVEVSANEVINTLAVLRKAVEMGELDSQIEAVSVDVRKVFKK